MRIVRVLQPFVGVSSERDQSAPHVLIVVDGLAGPMGGGERVALRLALLLPEHGYRVSILTFAAPTNAGVRANPPCPIYVLPLKRVFGFAGIVAAFRLRRFMREQQISIVQTFFESSDLWAGLVTKTMSSARLIWSRRDMGILRARKHSAAYRLMGHMPDRVFAVSELVRRHCIEVDRIDPRRVQTIYNGLDLAHWTLRESEADRSAGPVITTVGNIRHVKGHDLFVRAAAEVLKHYPDTQFQIAGSTLNEGYLAELKRLIEELGLAGHFHFAGGVKDLRAHFAAADIFVLPSRSEGFSNAIIEAMAMALPVIATNVGGNPEAVIDGVSGWIVPPEDHHALASAMLRLLGDPEGARAMGRMGHRIVSERFTIDSMMAKVTAAYAEVLGGKNLVPRRPELPGTTPEKELSHSG